MVYPYTSLISSLKSLLSRSGLLEECEKWRQQNMESVGTQAVTDVFQGRLWQEFLEFNGTPFLRQKYSIVFILNVDWFQLFKHREYSVGVMYLAIMNLPQQLRYRRENIIILGIFQGPFELSKEINKYLKPFVKELLLLWDGIAIKTNDCGTQQTIRGALLFLCCDLPASKKVCGFLSHSANLGCSKCLCKFATGVFGVHDFSGFDRNSWVFCTNNKHREDVKATLNMMSKTARSKKESEVGCRYSSLLKLPYFDPARMHAIDPMHNLYLGTAKHIFTKIWLSRNIIDLNAVQVINKRILSLNKPSEVRFGKLPACMEYSKRFTVEQWLLWVNYYSLYCLYDILPTQHLECWRHFVLASRLLCKHAKFTTDDIRLADALLLQFCRKFESLYGSSAVTPNIHLHAHLAECINDFGNILAIFF